MISSLRVICRFCRQDLPQPLSWWGQTLHVQCEQAHREAEMEERMRNHLLYGD